MTHGDYQIDTVETGRLGLDGGAMFGIVPKPLWEKRIAPDDQNRIPLAMRCLLLRGHGRTVLVDTGVGAKGDDKFERIYAVDHQHSALGGSLAALGVEPGDVTDVVLTHLHFDHAGGATERGPDGALRTAFPNAAYHVQRAHWEWAHESVREQASFLAENMDPIEASGQLVLADGEVSPFPGVSYVLVHGHTRAQQLVLVEGGAAEGGAAAPLLFAADLLPTAAHVPLPWVMAYDIEPLQTLREKERVLTRAADEGWTVVFEHDAEVAAARIKRTEKGFRAADARAAF
ncbi:MBL fold metallo-hydrolase [Rubrivirga litoralis]|uniref:MBL fold metallo-hydrolase n=1 Tax=Rubrivirga litoralis TaxID=3075598 RepID=A0ABU3BMG8_9BACT|nr:MBL fold metallo-hydrolase [Rubrivirga sp. F394]MDT0630484.1 MBL fold metallo-hydrolase [Rubrivirga sp. F394]